MRAKSLESLAFLVLDKDKDCAMLRVERERRAAMRKPRRKPESGMFTVPPATPVFVIDAVESGTGRRVRHYFPTIEAARAKANAIFWETDTVVAIIEHPSEAEAKLTAPDPWTGIPRYVALGGPGGSLMSWERYMSE
jgi:hypothetical protein